MKYFALMTMMVFCLRVSLAQTGSVAAASSCQETATQKVAEPAKGQSEIDTPRLCSVANFRDLAGISPAFGGNGKPDMTASGQLLQPGMVYRSNALALSPADLATVSKLGITEDIDLRTSEEIEAPHGFDVLPPGVTYINVNIAGEHHSAVRPELKTPADADKMMEGVYANFVTNPEQRDAFRMALLDMAYAKGPVLFHCTAGKDRSGWMAAILQSIAGVPEPTIMRDYLASNQYRDVDPTVQPGAEAGWAEVETAQPEYLQAGLDAAKQNYGSMDAYVTKGIGLSPQDVAALRTRMVE